MNVLSLFDGMSCGQQALQRAGIEISNYYASEIDEAAMAVTKKNFPNTIFVGDVTKVSGYDFDKIDLLIGGSPCQGFSFSGKRLNFNDPRSALFFEYVRILKELQEVNPNVKFLLENVVMEKKHEKVITDFLSIEPVKINSSLFSAQSRNRLYWTNIPIDISEINDKNIFWKDIQIEDPDGDVMYYSEQAFTWIFKEEKRRSRYKEYTKETKEKMQMIEASHHKGYSNQRCFGIKDSSNNKVRFIHPIECERCQTIEDNYSKEGVFKFKNLYTEGRKKQLKKYLEKNNLILNEDNSIGGFDNNHKKLQASLTKYNGIYSFVVKENERNLFNYELSYFENITDTEIIEKIKKSLKIIDRQQEAFLFIIVIEILFKMINKNIIEINLSLEEDKIEIVDIYYLDKVSRSSRYKMIGNAWTVDVISYIFSKLNS